MKTIPLVDEVPEYSSLLAVPLPTKNVRRLFPRSFSVVGSQISPEWSTYGVICHRQMITTDASLSGWGAVFKGRPAYGVWSGKYLTWHINGLELRAVTRVPLEDICMVAGWSSPHIFVKFVGWSSPHTFVKFHNLDVNRAPGSQVLSA